MPSSSTSALALASRLRTLGDPELAELIAVREVADAGIKDFFDLAEALLDRTSVQKALSKLDRPTLTSIAAVCDLTTRAGASTETDVARLLSRLGAADATLASHIAQAASLELLAIESGRVLAYDSVAEQLASWPSFDLPSLQELAGVPAPTALESVSSTDSGITDRLSAERAFTAATAIAELLTALQREPARQLARGGIGLPDSKRLAAAMSVELEGVPTLHAVAERAGLVALDGSHWLPTEAAEAWLAEPSARRWGHLAAAWVNGISPDVRSLLASRSRAAWGDRLEDFIIWLFPAGSQWMRERIDAYASEAELLGITADHAPSTAGSLLLTDGPNAAAENIAALLPAEVDKVYVQHDLTIVSPGPLAPVLDARLRGIADVESRALASSYRISAGSITRGMSAGETAESIRDFLSGISLTGIPQPLDYLLSSTATRYGLVRVGSIEDTSGLGAPTPGARSYIRSSDDTLLRTIAVDHALTALSLSRAGSGRLHSRYPADVVFWALSEAKYPVAAEDAEEQIIVLHRRRAAVSGPSSPRNPARALVEKLRIGAGGQQEETEESWLARQLDLAIKSKLALTVSVTIQDGSTVDYQLEPTGVAGGRLRARDRKSDIERTLPLSRITAISPPE